MKENVLKGRFAVRDSVDLFREGLNKLGDERVALGALDSETAIDHINRLSKPASDVLGKRLQVVRRNEYDIATDCRHEIGWRAQRDKASLVQDRHPLRFGGFVHQVSRKDYRGTERAAQAFKVIP